MAGSSFGEVFKVTTWGESHGYGIGAVVDGVPAGIPLSAEYIQKYLNRRKPGTTRYSTPRKEEDEVIIESGVFEGKTTGCPVSLAILNKTQHSADYSEIANYYRPGHADFGFDMKYGFRDYRGGGRSSGRETAARVAAGAVAQAFLSELGIRVFAYTQSIGPVKLTEDIIKEIRKSALKNEFTFNDSPLYLPDAETSRQAEDYLMALMKKKDSAGGTVECIATGVPAGIGEPVFGKLDARLAAAVMSIGAVKGIEIGDGFEAAMHTGSEDNDGFGMSDKIIMVSNHAGGILGGISDGAPIILRAAIKATPSIAMEQSTVNRQGEEIKISIHGRHDPVIVPRAVVVVESMTALTLADLLLLNMSSKIDNVKKVYGLQDGD